MQNIDYGGFNQKSGTNGPNKLECYITLAWKGLPATNTSAYLAHF